MGSAAFSNNHLERVTISENVRVIEGGVFVGNFLTSVVIPQGVTSIGFQAFRHKRLTIGANVVLEPRGNVFDVGFDDFYRNNGSKAGAYLVNWIHRP